MKKKPLHEFHSPKDPVFLNEYGINEIIINNNI